MPSPPSTTSDAPLGTFEEQVLLAVLRTGRARLVASERGEAGAGGSRRLFAVTPRGARALADSREMRDRLWRGVDLVPLLAGGNARGGT